MAKTAEMISKPQQTLFAAPANPAARLPSRSPFYTTPLGAAYVDDSFTILQALPDNSINAVITSPPYALHFQKEYGNVQ